MDDVTNYAAVDAFLEHHGILGMHWGVRKRSDAASKSPGSSTSKPKTKDGLTDAEREARRKKLILIGGIALGTLVAAGATYAVIKHKNSLRSLARFSSPEILADLKLRDGSDHKITWQKDNSLTGPKTLDEIKSQIVKDINPNYGAPGTTDNCMRATFAYEMRRRGFNVRATTANDSESNKQTGIARDLILDKIGKSSMDSFSKAATQFAIHPKEKLLGHNLIGKDLQGLSGAKEVFRRMESELPDGARGELGLDAAGFFGHSVAFEKLNGKLAIIDAQSGQTYANPAQFLKLSKTFNEMSYTRFDDRPINQEYLAEWLTDAKP